VNEEIEKSFGLDGRCGGVAGSRTNGIGIGTSEICVRPDVGIGLEGHDDDDDDENNHIKTDQTYAEPLP
jgi:hypothetical protein